MFPRSIRKAPPHKKSSSGPNKILYNVYFCAGWNRKTACPITNWNVPFVTLWIVRCEYVSPQLEVTRINIWWFWRPGFWKTSADNSIVSEVHVGQLLHWMCKMSLLPIFIKKLCYLHVHAVEGVEWCAAQNRFEAFAIDGICTRISYNKWYAHLFLQNQKALRYVRRGFLLPNIDRTFEI